LQEERRRRRREPTALREALRTFLRESGLGARIRHTEVFQAWTGAIGPDLARHVQAVRFERGELCVEVDSSVHLHELRNYTAEGFRQEANRRLGSERILRLQLKLKR